MRVGDARQPQAQDTIEGGQGDALVQGALMRVVGCECGVGWREGHTVREFRVLGLCGFGGFGEVLGAGHTSVILAGNNGTVQPRRPPLPKPPGAPPQRARGTKSRAEG